jgi:DNA-binding transcriptional MerR regulator
VFRIGEFSQIARVSGRLLRYYDSIGLLRPQHIDQQTGYRYYSAGQLQQLNRILALKDLGLTLDQIARMLDDKIDVAEIRGMLALKKAELEQSLSEEAARLRHIESRLTQIEERGNLGDYDVVMKSAPALPFLGIRAVYPTFGDAVATVRAVATAARTQLSAGAIANLTVVAHCDYVDEDLDLEIGVTLSRAVNRKVRVAASDSPGGELTLSELPAIERLATLVRSGPPEEGHLAFGKLGIWMEANGYRIDGRCREMFLDLPFQIPGQDTMTLEIQFPVAKAA